MGFKERLFMEDQNIFSHIFFIKEETPNRIPWGRGNGWVAVALTEVLLLLPEDHPGREKVMDLYRKFMEGACRVQDSEGMWHQVLNNHDSYKETSSTAMFMLSLFRGIRSGWLDEKFEKYALKAWDGLKGNSLDYFSLVSQLKEEFDIQLPQNEGESLYTVEEFSEYVRNKI